MHANIGFPLTLAYVQSAPAYLLLAKIKSWLDRENPVCLMHPHGFYVVLLCRTRTEEWRFHIWPKGIRNVVGMPAFIHTHDRHVESRVLQGELTNILYNVDEVTSGGRPLYAVEYGGDRYAPLTCNWLRRTGSFVEPTVQLCETVGPGEMYRVERHTFHEAVVRENLITITLVCMHGELRMIPVKVVGMDGYDEMISFARAEHRAQDLLGLIGG